MTTNPNGSVCLTDQDVLDLKSAGFDVDRHYLNYFTGITVFCLDSSETIGFHCDQSQMDAWIGQTQIRLRTQEQLEAFLAVMKSTLNLHNALSS